MTTNSKAPADTAEVWQEVTHPLKFPVKIGDAEPIASISLYEPDVEALEAIDALGLKEGEQMTVAQLRGIVVALSRQPEAVIKKLHARDFKALGEEAVPLLEAAQKE